MELKNEKVTYYTASKNVYLETSNYSTNFIARPNDTIQIKQQARKLRINNYLNDWLPPAVLRAVYKFKRHIKG